jgi:hypothetical protein
VNPQDLAASRFKVIRQVLERIEKAEAAHAAAMARLEQLRAQLAPAEGRDREHLGEALLAGKSEPSSEAEQIRVEIARQEQRVEALGLAVERARVQIGKLVDANRGGWRRQAIRKLAGAKARYESAIEELALARDGLSDEAALVAWIDSGVSAAAANDLLGGRTGADREGRQPVNFSRTLEELRRDCEHLAEFPVARDDPIAEPRHELAWRG